MTDKSTGKEKREAERVHKHLIIQFSADAGPLPRKWDISTVEDIGEKGVSFLAKGEFTLGETFHMLMRIPLRPFEWFEVTGKLVGIEDAKIKDDDPDLKTFLLRISFLDLQEEQKKLIHSYVSCCLLKQGGIK
ncbi:MAG: PilZ domain-containing protein [Candidatus Omnitrophota bacterium]|nr:PilZ domain-containing protein [Candidatus Omnitrophota bacterium]